ncbi:MULTISPECIES: cell division protein FtsL [unclassified Undibacterium]|uniref:cell division protein FtsL n=1 Tax=unclassified Undibacterium TaxID=2630295 RepID=UPI002AC932FB|nr:MULTISPECIES: cell division protein FtsL [unclassified Undibacterium]MEB0138650.1 cell division protein FtsL [Undibacterium sp. CCC2.1]MEB0171451.1 cell division protein FtsL [Undibacterium sp. CCC1.1]MEB0175781.1 cell division protein FtsL [Undibacterium sp. CCC3.4]MEB0214390.1 cell division protein FtsL [Undibacterium sp. 5I2]WPX44259.1 cell division protein FtsL [Undibacterium sp. CCC3.4]
MTNRINIFLAICLIACALSLINAQYQARRLFIELEREQSLSKQYELQWTQLRLDQSTYGKHARIEETASKHLNMVVVSPDRTQYLKAVELK